MKKPQLAGKLLRANTNNSPLYNTLAFAHYLCALEQIVTQYLPPSFKHHCQVSSYEYGKLVILCDSASWSSKLRFHTKHLISKLHNHREFSELKEISTLTNLRAITRTAKRRLPKAKKISTENSQLLMETAHYEEDTKLSDALERLAKHASISAEQE
jgi:hypothetical protein